MKEKYLASALAGLAFFGIVSSASAGHRHLAEEYADRVHRERQERLQEEARSARMREQAEMRRRAEEEQARRMAAERDDAEPGEDDEEDWEDELPADEGRKRAQAAARAEEDAKKQEQERARVEEERLRIEREQEAAAREKERQAAEAAAREQERQAAEAAAREQERQAAEAKAREAEQKVAEEEARRIEEEKRRIASGTTAEGAEGTGEGLLRRLMRRAKEKIDGAAAAADSAKPALHTAEPLPMKLLSAETINTGGTLILSDSPEYLKRPGILYTDVVKGDARVFYYHLNDTSKKLKVAVVLESVGGQYAVVRVTRRAVADPDQTYTKVGKDIQQEFFSDDRQTERPYIAPEERKLLLEKPDKTVVLPGKLASGMADFTASAPVRVTVLCYPTGRDPLQYVEDAEILPADEHRLRGTFVGMDRILRVEKYDPDEDGVACVILADGVRDKYSEGVDATDGSLATNVGNYGVLYRLEAYSRQKTRFFMSPMGGWFAGVVRVEMGMGGTKLFSVPEGTLAFGEKSVHPPFDENGVTTLLPSVDLSPLGDYRAKPPVFFEMSPPGASNLPVLFILAPEDIKLTEGAS